MGVMEPMGPLGLLERVSLQMSADIDRLLEQVDDKELTLFQLICDMEESIVDLRRETVTTLARQNRLRKDLFGAAAVAQDVEARASLVLHAGDETRARHVLGRGIGALKKRDDLEVEMAEVSERASLLVATLVRMEDRAQAARRKRDHLVRRRRAEGAGLSDAGVTCRESSALAAYADTVKALDLETRRELKGPAANRRRARKDPGARPLEGGEGC